MYVGIDIIIKHTGYKTISKLSKVCYAHKLIDNKDVAGAISDHLTYTPDVCTRNVEDV